MRGKSLRFAGNSYFVKQSNRVLLVELTGSRPAKFLTHVRYMIKFATAGDNAHRKVLDFLEALCVFLRPVAINGKAVPNVREDQGIDQGGQKVRWDLVTHVRQADEDTVAFFDKGRNVRVPGEVLVEHYAKVPHGGALTHCILAEPNGNGSHATTILTGTTDNHFRFTCIYFQTVGMEPDVQGV